MAVPSYSFSRLLLDSITAIQGQAEALSKSSREAMREVASEDDSDAQSDALSELNDLRKFLLWAAGAAERTVAILDKHNQGYAAQTTVPTTVRRYLEATDEQNGA